MKGSLSVAVVCRIFANLCAVATAFISIRLYNLYVSKEVYGTILVGLQIMGYLPFMHGGFRMVINQQMLAEPHPASVAATARFGQALQSYFLLVVMLGGMIIMVCYTQLPSARALGLPFPLFLLLAIAAAASFHAGGQLALLVAMGEQVKSSLVQSLWGLTGLFALWGSFALGWGVWAFPVSSGMSALATLLCVQIVLWQSSQKLPLLIWHLEKDFWDRFKKIWRPAVDCLHNQVVTLMIFTLDLIFVGILVGPGAATVYGIVSRMMGISRQVLQSLSEAAWPRLTQELDGDRKAQMMRKVDRLNAWIVGCWYGAMAATLSAFLHWLVKSDWVAGTFLINLILCRSFVISLISPHAYGLLSLGRFKDLARLTQREVIIAVICGIILSYIVGAMGIAAAFLLATLAVTSWQFTKEYFRSANETHWLAEWSAVWIRAVIGVALSLGISAGLWWLERSSFSAPGWAAMLAGGVGFGLPVGLVVIAWRLAGRVP